MVGKAILLLTLLQCFQNALAQGIRNFYNWEVSTSFAYEQHDKRLFDHPAKNSFLNSQPERWGTHWYGLAVSRNLLENEYFQLSTGVSYTTEIQSFVRPFSPWEMWPDSAFSLVGHRTRNYKIKHVQFPVQYNFKVLKGLRIELLCVPDFSFFKSPLNGIQNVSYKKYELDFYSISLYPSIMYRLNRFSLSAGYRIYQYKKIDQVIFSTNTLGMVPLDPWFDKTYETYNPTHIRLTIRYAFGKKKLDTRNENH